LYLEKTNTMFGTTEERHTLGAIPCAIAWLFRSINEQHKKTGARFSVRVSCLELTTDQQHFKDLLIAHSSGNIFIYFFYFNKLILSNS
jgi:kinesin family protein 26